MHIPSSTYRIQFNPGFGFRDAASIASYLAELGISDMYASPIFRARQGSTHGYDIVDPCMINPELGSAEDFDMLISELHGRGLFWLQDIVPNHMAYDTENDLLMDVLENGTCSPYYRFFDIEWDHPYENMRGRIIAPFLGKFYADALNDGEIRLCYDQRGFGITYYRLRLPVRIESYLMILEHNLQELEKRLAGSYADFVRYLGAVQFFKTIPLETAKPEVRLQQVRHAKIILWNLYTDNSIMRQFLDDTVLFFNGTKGLFDSFSSLDRLLSEQNYRLSFWKVATEEINYRRFFTVNDLISLRVDEESVFAHTHGLIFNLIDGGVFSGLRVDHVDGLYDPEQYLRRLRERTGDAYILVEKILEEQEQLPEAWPVQGTTGYNFLNQLNGIFCRRENARTFTRLYNKFTGSEKPYATLVHEKKQLIIGKHMAGNIDNLAQLIKKLSSRDRRGLDITLYGLRRAMVEVMAHFSVYRTYITGTFCSEADTVYIKTAIQHARERNPGLVYELNFIEHFLLLACARGAPADERDQWLHFVMNFQQFTGPVMAKALEDTVFYIYNRLLSNNEVGGSPSRFGTALSEFHEFSRQRAEHWPHELSATATHDTKRGEDVRSRINVLSELPDAWEDAVKNWSRLNRRFRKKAGDRMLPDANDEYFLYQTLIGAWPLDDEQAFLRRIKDYMIKAVREAKVHTAWIKPDTAYEEACLSFIENILAPSEKNQFLAGFLPFQEKIAWYGMLNSLSQTLLKITGPGVPDFYQGTELWDLTLVDPDNRRAIDFQKRAAFLSGLREKEQDPETLLKELFASWKDGRIKQFLIYRLLKTRNEHSGLFQNGAYLPLAVEGLRRDNLIAFARMHEGGWAVAAASRFHASLVNENRLPLGAAVWGDTALVLPADAPSQWHEAITQNIVRGSVRIPASAIFSRFPGALLIGRKG